MTGQAWLNNGSAPRWRFALCGVLGLITLAACASTEPTAPVVTAPPPVVGQTPSPAVLAVEIAELGYTPNHMRGLDIQRVAILLPFSARASGARTEAENILNAAELALFERAGESVLLIPKDTGGTPAGARAAAEGALADGADLILGPLFSGAVAAAGEVAAAENVPLIAFSTDSTVAGEGVFLLSFPPNEEVRRVTQYALEQGATRFGFAGPATAYGQVAYSAYSDVIVDALGEEPEPELAMVEIPLPEGEEPAIDPLTGEEVEPEMEEREFATGLVAEAFYDGGISAMTEAAARLASIGVERLDPAEAAEMTGANWQPSPASPFQVLLLPAGGDDLRMLAPVMLYEDIDPLLVKFIGTGLWRDPSLAREPALAHGWFAGPEPDARARFEAVYEEIFETEPSRLAGLGYDAASLAALLAAEGAGFTAARLNDPEGFLGVDGLFRFRENGTIERGLAVYTVRRGGFDILDPAPQSFEEMEEPVNVEPDPAS
jgi:hypothetical protein